jgi:hypothetical protein
MGLGMNPGIHYDRPDHLKFPYGSANFLKTFLAVYSKSAAVLLLKLQLTAEGSS